MTSSATLHRPTTRTGGSASSKHILLIHQTYFIGRIQPYTSFGFFQIGHLPFIKITFLDTCQKMVSTHAPQFRSNLFCSEINSNHACQRLNGSLSPRQTVHRISILPLGKGYKYLRLLSRWHFYCSIAPPSLLLKNSSAPPPPLQPEHPPRVKRTWHHLCHFE